MVVVSVTKKWVPHSLAEAGLYFFSFNERVFDNLLSVALCAFTNTDNTSEKPIPNGQKPKANNQRLAARSFSLFNTHLTLLC
jgi:hypothetical protein